MHFTLADLITDITQNSCEAGSSLVELTVSEGKGEIRFMVKDNGKGMTKEELELATDPFVTDGIKHPNRKVGFGLPFLIQTAEQSGGGWDIKSDKGIGTTALAWFDSGNVDTPPLGDIPGMFRIILTSHTKAEIIIHRILKQEDGTEKSYEVRKSELAEALGGLKDSGSLVLLGKYLRSLEEFED